jgi:hypothetical protein
VFKNDLFRPLVKISTQQALIPEDLILHNITLEHTPCQRGGYSDVYKGAFRGRAVAVKVLRVYAASDIRRTLKARCTNLPPN